MKIGIVVDDINESVEYYQKLFKPEEELIVNHQHPKKDIYPDSYQQYNGVKINSEMKWFIVDLNPVYLQVVEPCDTSPSPWLSYRNEHGPGVCFISFCVEDLKDHIEFMEKNDMPMMFLEEKGFERYAYFATQKKLGVTLEFKERKTIL